MSNAIVLIDLANSTTEKTPKKSFLNKIVRNKTYDKSFLHRPSHSCQNMWYFYHIYIYIYTFKRIYLKCQLQTSIKRKNNIVIIHKRTYQHLAMHIIKRKRKIVPIYLTGNFYYWQNDEINMINNNSWT